MKNHQPAPDAYATLRDRVMHTVLNGPGDSDPALRHAAAEGTGLPAEFETLVQRIHRHAYKVTDEDVARLQATHGDDQVFEVIVSAALGASRQRLLAGLAALDRACD